MEKSEEIEINNKNEIFSEKISDPNKSINSNYLKTYRMNLSDRVNLSPFEKFEKFSKRF